MQCRLGDKAESLKPQADSITAGNGSSNTVTWILPLDTQAIVLPHPADCSNLHVTFNEQP